MKNKISKKNRTIPIPDTYVILFCLMIVIAILTYIIPAGRYETVLNAEGTSVVDPESFHFIERNPVTLLDFLKSVYQGCQEKAGIIFMIILLGGTASMINDTGAISRGVSLVVRKFDKKALYAIPVLMIFLSLLGASAVLVDASIAFIPVGLIIAKKLDLDPLAGAAIIYLGCYAGWNASFMAPTSVQTAQAIAGLPLLSGTGFRFVVYLIVLVITIAYLMRYCIKVRADRSNSLMSQEALENFDKEEFAIDEGEFSVKDGLIIAVFVMGMAWYIVGSMLWSWGMDMMVAILLAVGLISSVLGRKSPNQVAKVFCNGMRDISFGAMIVGVAGSLAVMMTSANIIHTIIWGAAQIMTFFPATIAAVIMFLVNLMFNFFVPSGPAQAAIVIPIMAPLSDIIGLTRQVAVLCFQYGDGFSNSIIPTAGTLMATLGIAKIPYTTWLRFIIKLFLIWCAVASVAVIVAVQIGYC